MMRFPFWQTVRDIVLLPVGPHDGAALAVLHREDFPRPWGEDEFAGLIGEPTVFGFAAREAGRGASPPVGFVLFREVAGEAEILSIAVGRPFRRRGIGWMLLDAVLRDLHGRRAEALFLEVDETNAPALALYRRLGFAEVGRRAGYFKTAGKPATGALVMRRDLK